VNHDKIKIPKHLVALYEGLRELNRVLRKERWLQFRRIDPFLEALFEREEKAEFLGAKDVVIHDSVVINGNVRIGRKTHISQFCSLDGSGGLTIGKYCSLAAGVRIMTHDSVKWALSGGKEVIERSAVAIGDHCFIGANAVIVRGVNIGHRCVIGAGAVVTKDIPDACIAIGVPARIVGRVSEREGKVCLEFNA
jgi:acetyltransferase-like isoleucine patch superfamily enzyme